MSYSSNLWIFFFENFVSPYLLWLRSSEVSHRAAPNLAQTLKIAKGSKFFCSKYLYISVQEKKFYIATFSAPIVSGRQLGIKSYHNCWLTSVAFGYDLKIIKICEFWGDPPIVPLLLLWRFRNEVVGYAVRYMLEITAWLAPLRNPSTFDAQQKRVFTPHYC